MQGVNTRWTGSIPTASCVSWSVNRMLRKPSPWREFSRNRFWATVIRTAIASGSSDFTRRPSTISWTCLPSSAYQPLDIDLFPADIARVPRFAHDECVQRLARKLLEVASQGHVIRQALDP